MRAEKTLNAVGVDQKQWYRVGGVAALVLALGYVTIFPLYAHVGAPPNGGEAWFKYLPGKTTVWWTILGLSVFTDFLFVPVALALYLALKGVNRNAMLLATAFVGVFVVLDLAVTWSHYASILTLYRDYSTATDDAHRTGSEMPSLPRLGSFPWATDSTDSLKGDRAPRLVVD